MGRIKRKILSGFQWNLKWVRVMLTVSAIAILGLIFIPKFGQEKTVELIESPIVYMEETAADSIIINGTDTIERKLYNRPIHVDRLKQLPPQEEPFDWKGMVTWAIGVANGLILVILNIKNLILKKK